jgi:putative acetyltransferase
MEIVPVVTPQHLELVRELFQEYAQSLEIDLCFQNFQAELAGLPGAYALPQGKLLIAGLPAGAGCVAVRPIDGETCEMKRLYVRPAFRRSGLGRRLASEIIEAARETGYPRMRLDTLASMTPAIALYRSLGFVEIPAYYHNPSGCAVFMEKLL